MPDTYTQANMSGRHLSGLVGSCVHGTGPDTHDGRQCRSAVCVGVERLFNLAFHDTDTDSDSPDTSIHPYVRYARFPREDPREETAFVGRKTVAVFGESVSVSVSAPWNASFSALRVRPSKCDTKQLSHRKTEKNTPTQPILSRFVGGKI